MTLRDRSGKAIFADTGYWIASTDPRDELHEKARQVAQQYKSRRIITSELVLVEFMDGMAKRGVWGRQKAVELIERVHNDPNVDIVPMTTEQFRAALRRYWRHLDQRWSLTDCVSFLIMERLLLRDALAHDRDFAAAGFRPLLRDS